ncbi:MAG: MBL fold metallo-hydrolase [Puniceicoccales bacterium]|jgi:L-ascorbate metabolism protein UlaG (beta-lactamase superfamily)|nr:MBL fold metallo-hydrolase [Puniceicoccales bacterium]
MYLLLGILIITIAAAIYLHMPMFGDLPKGKYLKKIKKSPNYHSGQFHNQKPLPVRTSSNMFKTILEFIRQQRTPVHISSSKTDLFNLDTNEEIIIWFGHSSFFIQISGKRILVDPIFSETIAPIPFFLKAFRGSNIYLVNDMPNIDCLLITHDHWDHLDYKTVGNLKSQKIICPLGVGAHFRLWGFPHESICEMDWDESFQISDNLSIYCLPARHFSGRGLLKNKSLWASFLIETSDAYKIFISGDGGYDTHFAEIGRRFGGIDLAILENGQYSDGWKNIHMHPKETVQAAKDLHTKALFPVHMGKFHLATHPWNEPLNKISKLASGENFRILTPMIGEKIELKNNKQTFKRWWQ